MTILSLGISVFSFIQLFFRDYAQEASQNMVTLAWVGLVGGAIALFFVAPEFFYFHGKKQVLSDILGLDSRAEVMRLRKEAESAADLLGKGFQLRLKGLYERLGIKVPKRYSSLKEAPQDASKADSEEE
ncbi:MAG: hypothetical protein CMB67_03680 [Euryarchaeota archaeon]|nr:hypothetical protein [Euryarchaeota archaeon]